METPTDYKVLRLFTSDSHALTNIESADSSILLPHEIHIRPDGLGTVKACHANYGDEVFANLDSFCRAYRVDRRDVFAACQKAWQAVSVLVLLALSACGDNPCGCPFGTVCQPAPTRQEGFVCVAPPQASDAR